MLNPSCGGRRPILAAWGEPSPPLSPPRRPPREMSKGDQIPYCRGLFLTRRQVHPEADEYNAGVQSPAFAAQAALLRFSDNHHS